MVELAYTRDLKSLARIGLMGSSPIGATIFLSPVQRRRGNAPIGACRYILTLRELDRFAWMDSPEGKDRGTFIVSVMSNRCWGDF